MISNGATQGISAPQHRFACVGLRNPCLTGLTLRLHQVHPEQIRIGSSGSALSGELHPSTNESAGNSVAWFAILLGGWARLAVETPAKSSLVLSGPM